MRDDRDADRRAGSIVIGREAAADRDPDAEYVEIVAAHELPGTRFQHLRDRAVQRAGAESDPAVAALGDVIKARTSACSH
jgi:hypothetical protein